MIPLQSYDQHISDINVIDSQCSNYSKGESKFFEFAHLFLLVVVLDLTSKILDFQKPFSVFNHFKNFKLFISRYQRLL